MNALPNILTLIRIMLTAPLFYMIWQGDFRAALWIAIVAGLTDLLDGYLARAFDWQTRLGSVLDPTADKLMVFAIYLALLLVAAIPQWLFWLILARDLVISGGVLFLLWRRKLRTPLHPPMIGKATVATQVAVAVLSVVNLRFAWGLSLGPFFWIAAVMTMASLLFAVGLGIHCFRGEDATAESAHLSPDLPAAPHTSEPSR